MNKINIKTNVLRVRETPSLKGKTLGFAEKGIHPYSNTRNSDGYIWYEIDNNKWVAGIDEVEVIKDPWVKPEPTERDNSQNQLYVGNIDLRIRQSATTSSEHKGWCERKVYYNILDIAKKSDYTWYKIGDDAWAAGTSGTEYCPAGSSIRKSEVMQTISKLKSSLDVAYKCVDKDFAPELNETLYNQTKQLNDFIESNYDPIDYDLIIKEDKKEFDILYTADTHLAWAGSGNKAYSSASPQNFTFEDLFNYRKKLENSGIPTVLVDCGDWIHGVGNQENLRNEIINNLNNNYFATTFGNHEWYSAMGGSADIRSYLDRVKCLTACNFTDSKGNTIYKPYRTIKVGNKKIAIIGVGYPSPNGRGTGGDVHEFEGYKFYDAQQTTSLQPNSALYKQVQKYIDLFKENNFDYIIVITHMDKYTDEDFSDDGRFNSRAEFLIQNTKGLDVVIPGHLNMPINQAYPYTDLNGKIGFVAQEAGSSLNSFGRLRFIFNDKSPIQCSLITSKGEL